MTYISKFTAFLKKLTGFFLFTLFGFFRPGVIYKVTANRPLNRSYKRFFQGLFWLCLASAILLHALTPVMIIGYFLALMPLALLATAIDPFVAWLRGEDETPWRTFGTYYAQSLWALLVTLQTFLIVLIIMLWIEPEFVNMVGKTSVEEPKDVGDLGAYLVFSFFMVAHFVSSQIYASERKSHKIVSSLIFGGCYLGIPLITAIAAL